MKVSVNYQHTQLSKAGDPLVTACVTDAPMEIPDSEDPDEILFHVAENLKDSAKNFETPVEYTNVYVDGIPNHAILHLRHG